MTITITATLLSTVALLLILFALTFSNHKLYCYVFEHRDWVLWKRVCELIPTLEPPFTHYVCEEEPVLNNYRWTLPDIGIGEETMLIYWENLNEVSVHRFGGRGCVLSPYDRYHSDLAVEAVKKLI